MKTRTTRVDCRDAGLIRRPAPPNLLSRRNAQGSALASTGRSSRRPVNPRLSCRRTSEIARRATTASPAACPAPPAPPSPNSWRPSHRSRDTMTPPRKASCKAGPKLAPFPRSRMGPSPIIGYGIPTVRRAVATETDSPSDSSREIAVTPCTFVSAARAVGSATQIPRSSTNRKPAANASTSKHSKT
jgi:hypothetical protein